MSGPVIPPSVLEPGPRTAQKPGLFRSWETFLVVVAIVLCAVAIGGTLAVLVYMLASGRV